LGITKNIKQKISRNNALITLADKGNTTVIIYKKDYEEKFHSFLSDNFQTLPGYPTKKHQTFISKALQQCNFILHKNKSDTGHKNNPPNPLKAQLKLHKQDIPVRPVVNNRSSPLIQSGQEDQ